MLFTSFRIRVFVTALASAVPSIALAVPYASGVHVTTGSTWEFVLNESAQSVTVLRDGANPVNFASATPGRYTFDMTGFTNWEVKVQQTTPVAAWTRIKDPKDTSDPNRFYAHFEQPTGIAVNKDPASPYFGTVYLNNSRTSPTASGRAMGDGVYALTADLVGVDLTAGPSTYYAIPSYADTSFAKAPSPWVVGGTDTTGSSGWRMTLDASNNLILGDWSDGNGGIKYASPDLNTGGLVLAQQNGPTGGVIGVNGKPVHGSITSTPYVTGTVGNNLTVWAMDEDLHQTLTPAPGLNANGNHIWKWNVGNSDANGYNAEPTLVVNTATLPKTTDGRLNHVSINNGLGAEAFYSPQFKKWYIAENRFDGNDAGFAVVSANAGDYNNSGTIDAADYVVWRKTNVNGAQGYADWRANFGKQATTVDWSSLQFSIDNNLDGNNGLATGGANCTGATCSIQDIFRGMGGEISISPDGTKLYVRQFDLRSSTRSSNPYFGTATGADPALQGAVIIIPLDANGVPNIHVSGPGGTLTNVATLNIGVGASQSSRRPVAVDVAGNVYVGDANSEELTVWSPGGATLATTRSNGTFSLTALPGTGVGLAGVPEPSSMLLAVLGMLLASVVRRRS